MSTTLLRLASRFWWVVPALIVVGHNAILQSRLSGARSALLAEQNAHAGSIASWEAAVATARLLDLQNKQLVEGQQADESRRVSDEYQARIADARARAASVRPDAAPADPGGSGGAAVSGLSGGATGADAAAGQAGLSAGCALDAADALIATEQAIQLDELINWVAVQTRLASEKGTGGD